MNLGEGFKTLPEAQQAQDIESHQVVIFISQTKNDRPRDDGTLLRRLVQLGGSWEAASEKMKKMKRK